MRFLSFLNGICFLFLGAKQRHLHGISKAKMKTFAKQQKNLPLVHY
jgi:hypothetical protein